MGEELLLSLAAEEGTDGNKEEDEEERFDCARERGGDEECGHVCCWWHSGVTRGSSRGGSGASELRGGRDEVARKGIEGTGEEKLLIRGAGMLWPDVTMEEEEATSERSSITTSVLNGSSGS